MDNVTLEVMDALANAPRTKRELAAETRSSYSHVANILSVLTTLGLVRPERVVGAGRLNMYYLTDTGERVLRDVGRL